MFRASVNFTILKFSFYGQFCNAKTIRLVSIAKYKHLYFRLFIVAISKYS